MDISSNVTTLVAYANPTTFIPGCDHTFVHCPDIKGKSDNQKTFQCWSHGNQNELKKNKKNKVFPVVQESAQYAYEIADSYRGPEIKIQDDNILYDTAMMGVYGINGVCHQSANCFLLAAGAGPMLYIRDHNNDARPNGLWASYLLYGPWGNLYPLWKRGIFYPKYRKRIPKKTKISPLLEKLETIHAEATEQKLSINETIWHQICTIANHYEPDIDLKGFSKQHHELLMRKDRLIPTDSEKSYGILDALTEKLINEINNIAIEMQEIFETYVGSDTYEKLTGARGGQYFKPIDPEIIFGK